MERKALYAGTFDPPTNGHLWVIEHGSKLFDELHVAIGFNPEKANRFTFSVEERVEMLQEISRPYDNVVIGSFSTVYAVDHARNLGCEFLLRGIRNSQDHEAEQTLNHVNRLIESEVTTVHLPCPEELLKVSSSGVKSMIGFEGWRQQIAHYVPEFVYDALCKRFEDK